MSPIIVLFISTIFLWLLVFFLHTQKLKITLIPIYVLMGLSILVANCLVDLGFAITIGGFHLLIGSVSFFTTCLLAALVLYLLEGPRAARVGLFISVGCAALYSVGIMVISYEVHNSVLVSFGPEQFRQHFWSVTALILDIVFIATEWEMLTRVKVLPRIVKIFIVIYGSFLVDTFVFGMGYFYGKDIFWAVIQGNVVTRLILAIMMTPMMELFMRLGNYKEKGANKKIWEILNFKTDLEKKIVTLEEAIAQKEKAEKELKKKSGELARANITLEGVLEDIKIFKMATEAAADQIVFTDTEGIVLYANKMMERLTGYTRDEAMGKKAGKLWGGLMEKDFYKNMWSTIKEKKLPYKGELINCRKDGQRYETIKI
jgi:PAS domain S-box-containing protein